MILVNKCYDLYYKYSHSAQYMFKGCGTELYVIMLVRAASHGWLGKALFCCPLYTTCTSKMSTLHIPGAHKEKKHLTPFKN